jgi:hypothetical protein
MMGMESKAFEQRCLTDVPFRRAVDVAGALFTEAADAEQERDGYHDLAEATHHDFLASVERYQMAAQRVAALEEALRNVLGVAATSYDGDSWYFDNDRAEGEPTGEEILNRARDVLAGLRLTESASAHKGK